MSRKEKLLSRIFAIPSDFTWSELRTLLAQLGWQEVQGSGSRVKFDNGNPADRLNLHKPHPGNIVKKYALKQVVEKLESKGFKP